jgi:hypothetical protein
MPAAKGSARTPLEPKPKWKQLAFGILYTLSTLFKPFFGTLILKNGDILA